jgi:hypothetical protein
MLLSGFQLSRTLLLPVDLLAYHLNSPTPLHLPVPCMLIYRTSIVCYQQVLSCSRVGFSCLAWEDASSSIAASRTPPAPWYFAPEAHQADLDIFRKGWRLASVHNLSPGTFVAGSTPGIEFLITCDDEGTLRGFHNVCFAWGWEVLCMEKRCRYRSCQCVLIYSSTSKFSLVCRPFR